MAEYIDKEDAVGVIADWAEDTRVRVDSDHGKIYQRCIRLIRDLPPADVVERKHGKWLYTPTHWAYCSECGKEPPDECNIASDFCPNCGAWMKSGGGRKRVMDGFNEFLENVSKAVIKLRECNIRANLITLDEKKFGKLKMLNMKGIDPTIFGMKVEYANLPDDIDFFVQHKNMWKIPQTNGDRIRAMSDEELAEVIWGVGTCDNCYLYHRGCDMNTSCKDAISTWLKKEVDNG